MVIVWSGPEDFQDRNLDIAPDVVVGAAHPTNAVSDVTNKSLFNNVCQLGSLGSAARTSITRAESKDCGFEEVDHSLARFDAACSIHPQVAKERKPVFQKHAERKQ